MTNGSLMKVESIAVCSPWSILQYFWSALSDNWSWKPIFDFFESGLFTQVLLYTGTAKWGTHYADTPVHICPFSCLTWHIMCTYNLWTSTHKWTSTWENLSSEVCKQQRRRPACASVQTDQHQSFVICLSESIISRLATSQISNF